MVSIKDIAAACEVSIATVSKALNNHRDVSEETKQTIQKKAKEMGYFPNSQARALKTNRTYNIGVIFAERSNSGLTQDYFASLLNSFKKEVEKFGYDITFISTNIGDKNMTLFEHCMYRNIDGAMVACVDDYMNEDIGIVELVESRIPVIAIDYVPKKKVAVVSDNYSGMRDLINYIVDMGHKKVAYIYGDGSSVTTIRKQSFVETLKSRNVEVRDDFLVQGRYHDTGVTEQLVKSMLSKPREEWPTCIVAPDDFAALGVYNALEELGLSVPDDISVAGYDGIMLASVLRPRLTTLRQDTEKLGVEAAKKLIALINKEISTDEPQVIVGGELIKGESIRHIGG